ncbi:MAG: hypothetical protein ACR2P4_04750, partial [Gammaproteobacteria bacterium]
FRAMSLTTLSMFIASGADVNENYGNNANSYLLYQMAEAGQTAQFSLLLEAGADVNAVSGNAALLHYAVFAADMDVLNLLLSADGIEVNKVVNGQTALDRVSDSYTATNIAGFLLLATALRDAGGVCLHENNVGNPATVPVCGTAQQSPNIALPNNANKTFIIRSPDINTPAVIGNLSATPADKGRE